MNDHNFDRCSDSNINIMHQPHFSLLSVGEGGAGGGVDLLSGKEIKPQKAVR